jgi:hypothetical protein
MTNTTENTAAVETAIRNAARQLLDTRFNLIPSAVFDNDQRVKDGEYDEVLQLVGAGSRCCPECDEEVEEGVGERTTVPGTGGQTPAGCGLDAPEAPENDEDDEDDDEPTWFCPNCEASSESTGQDLDELRLKGSDYCWPAAHGTLFWTVEFGSSIVDAAVEAGFKVFEPSDFGGYILAIDGGGYNFIEEHWVPLYKALGLTWHEAELEAEAERVDAAVRPFVAQAQASLTGLSREEVMVRDEALATELDVTHSPDCGVYLVGGGSVDCDALVGPRADGSWVGLVHGEVRVWTRDEVE